MVSTYNARTMIAYLVSMLVAGNPWGSFNRITVRKASIDIVKCMRKPPLFSKLSIVSGDYNDVGNLCTRRVYAVGSTIVAPRRSAPEI